MGVTTDLDKYLCDFKAIAVSIFNWIDSRHELLNQQSSPAAQRTILDKLEFDCNDLRISKIRDVEKLAVEIENFELVKANMNIQMSVNGLLEQVFDQYNALCDRITKVHIVLWTHGEITIPFSHRSLNHHRSAILIGSCRMRSIS